MKSLFAILIVSISSSTCGLAAVLRGTITNAATGTFIPGAAVFVPSKALETLSDKRGNYHLDSLTVGQHILQVNAVGFGEYRVEIEVTHEDQELRKSLELQPIVGDEAVEEIPRYIMPEVEILATRASSEHPVTFTNLSRDEVDQANYGQDVPLLLSGLPNVHTYSEGGNGFGYSYLRIRGLAQDRVAVQVNGIPLNDAESHEVFWVDLPDLAEDIGDIQIQRGVGSSLYGPAAFGGTVNLVTRTPGLGDRALIRSEGMYGSWNTRRAMIQFQSGRVQNRYGILARLTRVESDGYRFGSGSKLWSYYLAGARFTNKHTSKAIFYGGPEQVHLAYEGVSRDYLEGRITGIKQDDRRFNPFQFSGEVDNFFQPHYELHDTWKISERLELDNSLYLFRGNGYYDQFRAGEYANQYFFEQADTAIATVLRRRKINETDGGWIPRMSLQHKYGATSAGFETRWHEARHEGFVIWSDFVPIGVSPDYRYYDYEIHKRSYSAYIHNLINVAGGLKGMLDLQFRAQHIEMLNDNRWHVQFEKSYSALSPRTGIVYQFMRGNVSTARPSASVYASISFAEREPRPRDIYDPQDYFSLPIHDYNAGRFRSGDGPLDYVGPSLKPEKLTDLELGTHWQWRAAAFGVNLYHMTLRDAIVPYGALDNLGVPLSINANETLHQGVEFVAGASLLHSIRVSGNLSLTDHHFVDHSEFDWISGEMEKRDGNRIGFDPAYIGNAKGEFNFQGARTALEAKFVGKQYVDNAQVEATAVTAYSLISLDLGYRWEPSFSEIEAIEPDFRVTNLLSTEYESFGYNYGEPLYIVGAPRAYYLTLGIEW